MPTTPEPLCLIAELTYKCPLQCPYCSNPSQLAPFSHELTTDTWKRVLAEAAELGVVQVHFSGGEPMARPDLAELIAEARGVGLYTHLVTGGSLADDSALDELRDAGLDALQISLQDVDPAQNDWLAGAESFEKKREAFAAAKRRGFPVTLNVVLHRHNLPRLEQVIEVACRWNANKLELAHVQYTGWAYRNRNALLPSRQQLEEAQRIVTRAEADLEGRLEILHVLPDYHQEVPKACLNGWGRVFLTVAPDGAVLPCQSARDIVGLEFPDVQSASLREIWFSSPVFQRFRGTDWMPEPCQSCDRREVDFGGCRCQAFLLAGDAGVTDPVCHLSPHHAVVQDAVQAAATTTTELEYRRFSNGPLSTSGGDG